jgi:hypothetical protein
MTVSNEPEIRADIAAAGVIQVFNDSVSEEVHVSDALLAFLGQYPREAENQPPSLPVSKPKEASKLAWKTLQRLMTKERCGGSDSPGGGDTGGN